MSATTGRSAGLLLTLTSLLLATTAGCGSGSTGAAPVVAPSTTTPDSSSRSAAASSSPSQRLPTGPAPLPTTHAASVTSVTIDSIGVRTTGLEKLATDHHGVLAAPRDPERAGWYSAGTVPGETGPAVIAGHVDSTHGPAVFFDLKKVRKGDAVKVGLSGGRTTTFVVDRVITTPKDGFPTDEVFGSTPDAELRLITCGGPYDRTVGSYVDNTVVFATARTPGS